MERQEKTANPAAAMLRSIARTRSLELCAIVAIGTGLACSESGSEQPPSDPPGEALAGRAAEPNDMMPSEVESREDGESPGAEPPPAQAPAVQRVQDRCVSASSCGLSTMPAQPELEFLEDMGDGWRRLMELDWHVAAEAEGYRCKTFTIPEDVFVTAFAPQVPPGTHHTAFPVSAAPTLTDSVFACDVNSRGERGLQAAGVGSDPADLPPGVAMELRAGQQVFMNLHLFNPRETDLQGRSGMWVKTVPEAEVEQQAEVVLVGPLMLEIPVGQSKHGSSCTVREDATIFAVAPHMHFTGVHARATLTSASGETVLHDGPFDPYDGGYYDFDALEVKAGDKLNVECTFENTGDKTLFWGDSALAEMCFINFSLYPALPYGNGPCTN